MTAVNAVGESPPSPEVSASSPTAPRSLSATPGDTQVTLSWDRDPVRGADSYNIYWSTTAEVSTANRSKITNATSPYTQMPLTNGTTYYYIVTAVNATGESPPSPEIYATAGAPAAPSSLSATPGDAQVSLSWDRDPVRGADSYNIYWSTTAGVTTASDTHLNTSGTFRRLPLTNGTTYYFIVTAVNATGESPPSPEIYATPLPPELPAAPSRPFADPSITREGTFMILVSWDPVSGADSYNIYWSTTAGVTTANRSKITKAASPYTQMPLTNGTTYYYIVTAVSHRRKPAVIGDLRHSGRTRRTQQPVRHAGRRPGLLVLGPGPGPRRRQLQDLLVHHSASHHREPQQDHTRHPGLASAELPTAGPDQRHHLLLHRYRRQRHRRRPDVTAGLRHSGRTPRTTLAVRHAGRRRGRLVLGSGPRRRQLQHLLVHHSASHHREPQRDHQRHQPVHADGAAGHQLHLLLLHHHSRQLLRRRPAVTGDSRLAIPTATTATTRRTQRPVRHAGRRPGHLVLEPGPRHRQLQHLLVHHRRSQHRARQQDHQSQQPVHADAADQRHHLPLHRHSR